MNDMMSFVLAKAANPPGFVQGSSIKQETGEDPSAAIFALEQSGYLEFRVEDGGNKCWYLTASGKEFYHANRETILAVND